MTPRYLRLPCGGNAVWDDASDMGYRCMHCYAMLGSIGQPRQCQDADSEYKIAEKLGGKGWDYLLGRQAE